MFTHRRPRREPAACQPRLSPSTSSMLVIHTPHRSLSTGTQVAAVTAISLCCGLFAHAYVETVFRGMLPLVVAAKTGMPTVAVVGLLSVTYGVIAWVRNLGVGDKWRCEYTRVPLSLWSGRICAVRVCARMFGDS